MMILLSYGAILVLIAVLGMRSLGAAAVAVIFLFPIVPKFLSMGVGEEGLALTLQRLVVLEFTALMVGRALFGRSVRRRAGSLVRARLMSLLFLGAWIMWSIGSAAVAGRSLTNAAVVVGNLLLGGPLLVSLGYFAFASERYARAARTAVYLAVLVTGVFVALEMQRGAPLFTPPSGLDYYTLEAGIAGGRSRAGSYRAMGAFSNPLELAVFLVSVAPLLAWGAFRERSKLGRLLAAVGVVVVAFGTLETQSRAGLLVMSAVFLAVWLRQAAGARGWLGLARRSFLVATGLLGAVWVLPAALRRVLEIGGSQGFRSIVWRQSQLEYGIELLLRSPYFGYGPSRNVLMILDLASIDNLYLRFALDGGLVGLGLFLLFIGSASRPHRRATVDHQREIQKVLLMIVGAALAMMMVVSIHYAFFLLFIAIGGRWASETWDDPADLGMAEDVHPVEGRGATPVSPGER